jgi:hypothetical protein
MERCESEELVLTQVDRKLGPRRPAVNFGAMRLARSTHTLMLAQRTLNAREGMQAEVDDMIVVALILLPSALGIIL